MRCILPSLSLLILFTACGGSGGATDGGPGGSGLAVMGVVTANASGASSRLDFSMRTGLVDDRGMLASGDTGGRCVIMQAADGGTAGLDVAVEETGTMLDAGIHQLEVRLDGTRVGALSGVVTASLGPADPTGAHTYVGGPDACVTAVTFDAVAHTASITLSSSCTLVSASGMATVSGTLSYTGCSVE